MSAKSPKANLGATLRKKKDEAASTTPSKNVADTFRTGEEPAEPLKKATYELPVSLHRDLNLHAVQQGTNMRDLVIRYIEAGLKTDGAQLTPRKRGNL